MAESKKQAGGGRVVTPKPGAQSGADVESLSKAVGARIKVTTTLPGTVIEGTLFTLCKITNLLAIKDANSPPAPPTPSSTAPGNYHLISLANVTGFEIVQPAEGEMEQIVPQITKTENDALNTREAHAIREAKKFESSRGKGVSKEAQEIHDHIMRTLPTRWSGKDIIVNDSIILEPPYRPENCKAAKDKQAALDQIKKVVQGYYDRKAPQEQAKGGKQQMKGPLNSSNRNTATALPIHPHGRKGG